MNRTTLTRRLFLRITPTILVTILAIGGFAFNSATREINNIYDAQLINNANVLWMLLEDEFEEAKAGTVKKMESIDFNMDDQLSLNEDADDYADAHMFRAWKSGQVMMAASTAFPETIPEQPAGLSYKNFKNETWRIYVLPVPKTQISIEVGEKIALRHTLVSNILLNLFYPLLVLIPIIGALVWFGINNGLGTIRALVQQIRSRSPDDLSAIPVTMLPRDLSPLGESINQLLVKLERSLTAERRFSDNAAHQLRTPQASLKLLLQMLSKTSDEEERKVIVDNLIASNNSATQLIQQLLKVARVSHEPVRLRPVSLRDVVASAIAEVGPIINEKQLNAELEADDPAMVKADESLLRLMVTNLIDNAVKYTPRGGTIRANIYNVDMMCCLSICDSGPGIPQQDRELVFRRFYRVGTPEQEGVGLGLAIVGEVLERIHGQITLKTPPSGHGVLVEVLLQKADSNTI